MTALRTLVVLLWAIFGLTTTAYASTTMAAPQTTMNMMDGMPCHVTEGSMASHQAPQDAPTAMPCCSQPVVVAPQPVTAPAVVRTVTARLSALPHLPLNGLSVASEPRPPKTT